MNEMDIKNCFVIGMTIFLSESSWGSIYSIFGVLLSIIGVLRFTKKLNYYKILLINLGNFIIFIIVLPIIDYLSVINIKQAPRFSIYKISSENTIYYDTLFYDVVRCNKDTKDEYYKIIKNQKYDNQNIQKYCKWQVKEGRYC